MDILAGIGLAAVVALLIVPSPAADWREYATTNEVFEKIQTHLNRE